MRALIIIAALMMGPSMSEQKWTLWRVSASFAKDKEGFKSFRALKGKDSDGGIWQINWEPAAVVVIAPDGSRKALDRAFPVEAYPRGGMSISNSGIERWRHRDWECLRVRIDTGRNGIGMDYFLVVVIDWRSKDWAVLCGRDSDESIEGPLLFGDDLALRWNDEEDKRPLGVKHEWRGVRNANGIRVITPPVIYQLQYGYPYWFRFWSDVTSPDPDQAEQQGWRSIAWGIKTSNESGGTAIAAKSAIPKRPGKQVWQKGTGPVIWFPVKGIVAFKWEQEVEVIRIARPEARVTPQEASRLATTGAWELILKRDSEGKFLGSMLIGKESGN